MPGSLRPSVSVGVLPFSLSSKFQEVHAVQGRRNEYHDGTTQSQATVYHVRRTWRRTVRLTPSQMTALRAFQDAHQADAFYFYNPSETSPPYTSDPTGAATAGRYTVRLNSDWSQTMAMARGDATLELIEVGDAAEFASVLNNNHGAIVSGSATLTVWTSYNRNGLAGGVPALQYSADGGASWTSLSLGGSDYTLRQDTFTVALTDITLAQFQFFPYGTLLNDPANAVFDIYDCSLAATYADSTTVTRKPTAYAISLYTGTVTNPTRAFDADTTTPTTYATITTPRFSPLGGSNTLTLFGLKP